ncbi:hypothetical protein Prudu_293S000100, partial [Prunus dulcis]
RSCSNPGQPFWTDDELREALRRWSRKELQGACKEDEIPAEVIAESIALAQKQQKGPSAELTSSELALLRMLRQNILLPFQRPRFGGPSASDPVEVPKATGALAAVSSPLKPPIVADHLLRLLADPELEEFEAMDLDAQLDKLEKLSSPPSKAKPRAVQEAMERLKIWQSTELEFDEDKGALDQLMKESGPAA